MNFEKLYIPIEAVERFTVLYQILSHAAKRYPNRAAYCQPEGKDTRSEITFAELKTNVNALRAAMVARGLAWGHSAIFGESSYQWITAYLALVTGCGAAVPLDKENPVETVAKQSTNSVKDSTRTKRANYPHKGKQNKKCVPVNITQICNRWAYKKTAD